MKFSLIVSAIALASSAMASPPGYSSWPSQCITQKEAEAYIKTFIGVLGQTDKNAAQTADKIIADDFVEYSNSILSLQHKAIAPGDNISAPNKATWTAGVLHSPQIKGITTKAVIADCNHIVWKWNFLGVGSAQFPVNGYNFFTMTRKGKQLQAQRLDLEFDSIAWGLDIGEKVSYQDGVTLPAAK
ncbi:uncharacterized protein MYCFIDRAFT_88023 [Pseudocercospora fijiensis CIRAD86]|uniref:NTF2-like domain-containing protein n=1 Tax=Pseudocercospora fijiensis (strain CIRAD86) TaxID=383855 RepID=M3AW28_PSEFD|nr:uncharacterized protein MYCFIDRAFT_88023 [Pseudocercospora fijiensis CIRAD86]EME81323.1 hypothetical protein MYCFIDRAFT_88023 [Pseudocercospora fijiensis CIRAD86]